MPVFAPEGNLDRSISNYLSQTFKRQIRFVQIFAALYCWAHFGINVAYGSALYITILWGIGAVVVPIIFLTCVRRSPRKRLKTRCQVIWGMLLEKVGVICLGFLLAYLIAENIVLGDTPYIFFAGGVDLLCVFFIFQVVFTRWHSFPLMVWIICLFLLFQAWFSDSITIFDKAAATVRLTLAAANITVFEYLALRNFRDIFSMKDQLEERDSVHKEIFDLIPESIIILTTKLELKYFNECFRKNILDSEEELKVPDLFLSRFTGLSEATPEQLESPQSMTLTRDLKSIIEEVICRNSMYNVTPNDSHHPLNIQETPRSTKGCRIFRGNYVRSSQNSDQTPIEEAVEVKVALISFLQEQSILIVVRQTPEFTLLDQLNTAAKYKDEILASVSHELRTPISSNINLLGEALKAPEVPQEIKKNLLDPAYKCGKLLLNLVNDILDMSQIKEKKLKLVSQVCDLRKISQECHYLFEHQCKLKNIALKISIDKRVPTKVRTDPNRLTQIILNLLSNSYKFTFEGEISISLSLDYAGLVKIAVKDTGIGIKEEDREKLMKKFEKIDLGEKAAFNSTGSGLGLSIANSLAILLGPNDSSRAGLKFESEWGKGTTAWFVLKSRQNFTSSKLSLNSSSQLALQKLSSNNLVAVAGHEDSPFCLEKLEYDEEDSSEFFDEERVDSPVYSFFNKGTKPKISEYDHFDSRRTVDSCNSPYHRASPYKKASPYKRLPLIKIPKCGCPQVAIVDDDGFNVLTLGTLLRSLSVKHESALSGIELVNRLKQAKKCGAQCSRFSLIIMDGNMPVMNGYETIKQVFAWNGGLKDPWNMRVVGCTAYADKEKCDEFVRAGASETVTKPIDKSDLSGILTRFCII